MNKQGEIVEKFQDFFQQWEKYLSQKYSPYKGFSLGRMIDKFWKRENRKLKDLGITRDDLLNLKRIRNVSAHDKDLIGIEEKAVFLIEKIVHNFCKTAKDIATLAHDIYRVNTGERVFDVIREMNKKHITYVPVIERNNFLGIFSKTTVLELVAERLNLGELLISDIMDKIRLSESSDNYEFMSMYDDYYAVYQMFQHYIDRGKKLGVIFLTEDGRETGEIKGLVSAWDLNK